MITATRIKLWKSHETWITKDGIKIGTTYRDAMYGGFFVTWIQLPDGKIWQCSDRKDWQNDPSPFVQELYKNHIPLPEWAKSWVDKEGLVRPLFEQDHSLPVEVCN